MNFSSILGTTLTGLSASTLKAVYGEVAYVVLNPLFLVGVAAILILERFFPAKPKQRLLSVSFLHDFIWIFLEAVGRGIVIVWYVNVLRNFYGHHLSFLTMTSIAMFPAWVRLLWGLVLTDFLKWLQHLLQHKIHWLWRFHSVHHSQRELNMFSDQRNHFVEYVWRETVYALPLMMLAIDTPEIVALSLFRQWYGRLNHSNVKTNLGPFRYLLVTPQSHRIHHSIEPQHFDTNYGGFFSFWDYLFGTQYRKYGEYPDTGILDEDFPHEASYSATSLIFTPIRQTLYPFKKLYKEL